MSELNVKITKSRIIFFKKEKKISSIEIYEYEGLEKISFNDKEVEIITKDNKLRKFDIETGKLLFISQKNGNKNMTERMLRKLQYLSRRANEERQNYFAIERTASNVPAIKVKSA